MSTNPFGSSPVISVGADPAGIAGPLIRLGDWWPAIDTARARAAMRLDGNVTEERLRDALIEAAAATVEHLADWQAAQLTKGYARLQDVPALDVDGESVKVHRFRRAVFCTATANLSERYRNVDTTYSGNRRAEIVELPIDDLRRDAAWAIADIQGRPHTTIELI